MLFKVRLKNFIKYFSSNTNKQSKKIVYIDHSYHEKTKSNNFLRDYLKKYFEVTVILDETWQGKDPPNLDFIDNSYLGVVFFQMIYSPKIISKIKNKNIIFCPMYDFSGRWSNEMWKQYKNLKFINFSLNLHKKLISLGMNSLYVKYFPEIKKYCPGDKKNVYFWQRITSIDINKICELFTVGYHKIHLHKAIDPDQKFKSPTVKQTGDFSITISNWYKNKSRMLNDIEKCGIYVAPREYEGIGLSFLEAMSMGKAVVSLDNPTMNEYIKNNKTGYFFDVDQPKKINFKNIELVQRNAYDYMARGYKNWLKNRVRIIDFIQS